MKMSRATIQNYFNLKETADFLGISYRSAKNDWRGWERWGVRASRYNGESNRLIFKRSDLEKMVQQWEIRLVRV